MPPVISDPEGVDRRVQTNLSRANPLFIAGELRSVGAVPEPEQEPEGPDGHASKPRIVNRKP